jgi:hypothetical protein
MNAMKTIRDRRRGGRLRTFFFFKPMAIVLALSILPPEFTNWSLTARAEAATPVLKLTTNCIQAGGQFLMQLVCNGDTRFVPPSFSLRAEIQTFESDTIKQFLALYQLPNSDSDVAFFYAHARSGLRSTLRAFLEVRMADITLKDPATRTANETTVYNWFLDRVWQHEKHMYQSALDDRNAWAHDHCSWKPDADIAKAYKINYIPCVGSVLANNAPTLPYFLTAARKREYDQSLAALNGSRFVTASPHTPETGASHFVARAADSSGAGSTPTDQRHHRVVENHFQERDLPVRPDGSAFRRSKARKGVEERRRQAQ